MKDNSIKKDIGLAAGAIVAFYLVLLAATWIDQGLGLSAAFTLVDVASLLLKVSVASATTWLLARLTFKNTIGKDIGETFNKGWSEFSFKLKAGVTLGFFVAVFIAILAAS